MGTSKNGELGQSLKVVSFVHGRKDEELGKYEDFENRRIERGLQTKVLKGYVNTISKG